MNRYDLFSLKPGVTCARVQGPYFTDWSFVKENISTFKILQDQMGNHELFSFVCSIPWQPVPYSLLGLVMRRLEQTGDSDRLSVEA